MKIPGRWRSVKRRDAMVAPLDPKRLTEDPSGEPSPRRAVASRRTAVGLILGAPLLSACAGVQQSLNQFSNPFSSSSSPPPPGPSGPPQQPQAVGNGQVKVGLILPLSAAGNAGGAPPSMKK